MVGQGITLHGSTSRRRGQGAPPLLAGLVISRTRWRSPPPHLASQTVHCDHGVTSQSKSSSHIPGEHILVSFSPVRGGHGLPFPADASKISRVLVICLVLQLHVVHGLHPSRRQSTGHSLVMQSCFSMRLVSHCSPSPTGHTSTPRLLLRVDGPQDAEHAVHSDQSASTQSTAQGSSLHTPLSIWAGQLCPFPVGFTTISLWRMCRPPSHDLEHSVQGPQSPTTQSWGQS
mmetsp:Transcript_52161/g.138056  ORF Transcript_52161/g.138056 Transcript_52161/m.138056 type:complete len:230 (+) Transcript_52161:1226-1915(+)